ncbi:glycoside hydrolase family 3 N-terminal domain-containing protein, partial [Thiobacillus sp.]|uniref:glycoside hydrolase family 3 N-terminal domain-containing protein n=1 Tax=Thiobacillus sp. TaxID=924 RepID=UPI0025F17876
MQFAAAGDAEHVGVAGFVNPQRDVGQQFLGQAVADLAALEGARAIGFVLAAELRAHGVDLSFTPVLDLDYGCCRAIGNRAFHRDPQVVAALAQALVAGMAEAGMGAVGKHFPGHG